MTNEDAIYTLDRLRHIEAKWPGTEDTLKAIEMAIRAIRAVSSKYLDYSTAHINREAWEPCNFCAGAKYITGEVTAVYPVSETRQQETLAKSDFDFCPVCGKPLTDEAVQAAMERLKVLHGETD